MFKKNEGHVNKSILANLQLSTFLKLLYPVSILSGDVM